ncbi:flagellar export chaperone FlgN [Duganella sp. Root1480D1]|uniref:flagellar export chaperone FlgN n=1 Tax=Duganella sp. Root1480D1 TaxID=1736471 RepID=UPI001E4CDBE0|nr:flagellar export chaperone FlgN [Duganella sp. Root1480D1]
MSEISRQDAMKMLLEGIRADLQSYQQMLDLIAQQFEAAIRHQSDRLGEIAQEIANLVDVLEARRAQRVELAIRLVGPQPSMEQVFTLLKPEARARLEADWAQLEGMVQTAREMGRRNADLLAEQYTIMQRVLHGDDQTYEPV